MQERPIIFSTEMVEAILEGRKTQTRRVIKPQPTGSKIFKQQPCIVWNASSGGGVFGDYEGFAKQAASYCPYGQVGDRLWCTQGSSSSKSVPLEERFWGRIIVFSDHWEWMGRTNRKKYGIIRAYGKHWSTHRLMWKLQNGNIPEGLHILHRCDMPWCVNPHHLYLGTNEDNIADKMRQGRVSRQYGEANAQCKLSWEQIEEIKALYWEQHFYQADIAERFGISQSEVSRIVHNKRWREGITDISPTLGHRTLEIVSLRAERLQEITLGDAIAEGVARLDPNHHTTAVHDFQQAWDSLNAKRGYPWTSNPWVWAIEFRQEMPTGT